MLAIWISGNTTTTRGTHIQTSSHTKKNKPKHRLMENKFAGLMWEEEFNGFHFRYEAIILACLDI